MTEARRNELDNLVSVFSMCIEARREWQRADAALAEARANKYKVDLVTMRAHEANAWAQVAIAHTKVARLLKY